MPIQQIVSNRDNIALKLPNLKIIRMNEAIKNTSNAMQGYVTTNQSYSYEPYVIICMPCELTCKNH